MNAFRIQLIATGGTLAKGYDAHGGQLVVDNHIVDSLLTGLTLPSFDIETTHLMARDSLDMDESDRRSILNAVQSRVARADAVIIVHGTDTLCQTSTLLSESLSDLTVPVVFTGAMVPHTCQGSDAAQNLSQAIMACRLLSPGVHIVFHGQALDGARAAKNHDTLTFEAVATSTP